MALLLFVVAIDCSPTIKSDVILLNETAPDDDAVINLFCNRGYFLRGASVACEGNASWSSCREGYFRLYCSKNSTGS